MELDTTTLLSFLGIGSGGAASQWAINKYINAKQDKDISVLFADIDLLKKKFEKLVAEQIKNAENDKANKKAMEESLRQLKEMQQKANDDLERSHANLAEGQANVAKILNDFLKEYAYLLQRLKVSDLEDAKKS